MDFKTFLLGDFIMKIVYVRLIKEIYLVENGPKMHVCYYQITYFKEKEQLFFTSLIFKMLILVSG